MTSKLNTIFGQFETPVDGISSREFGGPGHGCRRTFQLVNGQQVLAGIDIQGRSTSEVERGVLDLLQAQGFQRVSPAPAAV